MTNPDTRALQALADKVEAGLTMPQAVGFMERWCLQYMDEMSPSGYDGWGFSLNCFTSEEFTRDMARAILRGLTDKGLAKYMRGLWSEDGMPAGSGYGITDKGRALIAGGRE